LSRPNATRVESRNSREDPISADVHTKDWFITLRPEMAKDARRRVEELSNKPTPTRLGQIPNLLKHEVARIERDKWKLV
jgi:hypothetical protein